MKIIASAKTPSGEVRTTEVSLPDTLAGLAEEFGEQLILSLLHRGIQQKISRPLRTMAKRSRTQEEINLYFSAYSKTLSQPGRLVKVGNAELERELASLDLTKL